MSLASSNNYIFGQGSDLTNGTGGYER